MSVIGKIKEENARTIAKQRDVAFEYLFDKNQVKPDVMVGKFYLFEYDPKTKAQLARWDRYPLVLVTNIYNLNNNVRIPLKLLHRYIVNRADNLFFEVPESELVEFAALPIEQFYDARNRFVIKKKVQQSNRR